MMIRGYGSSRKSGSSGLNTPRGLGIVLIVHAVLMLLVAVAGVTINYIDVTEDSPPVILVQQLLVIALILQALAVIMSVTTVSAGVAGASMGDNKPDAHNYAAKVSMQSHLVGSLFACVLYQILNGFVIFYEFESFVVDAEGLLKIRGVLLVVQFIIAALTLLIDIIALISVSSWDPSNKQEMYAAQPSMPTVAVQAPQQAMMPTYGTYSNTLGYSYPSYMQQGMYR